MKLIDKDVLTACEIEELTDRENKKGNLMIRTTDEKQVRGLLKAKIPIWTQLDGEDDELFYGKGWHLVNRTGQWFVLLKETEVF